MKKHFTFGFGLIFFFLLLAHDGLAQVQTDEESVFDPIRSQMTSATAENQELTKQNKKLKSELITLQLQIEKVEREIRLLQPEIKSKPKLTRERDKPLEEAQTNFESLDDDALIHEAQQLYLSGRHTDLDIEQKFQELYLYDLQYLKQELQLDLKEKQILYGNIEGERRRELDALQREIQENNEKEYGFSSRKQEMEEGSTKYSRQINRLTRENKALREKINQLKGVSSQ